MGFTIVYTFCCWVPLFIVGFNIGFILNVIAIPAFLLTGPILVIYWLADNWVELNENKSRAKERIQNLIEGKIRLDGNGAIDSSESENLEEI